MARSTPLSDEQRAQIGAALLSGVGVREVSRQFGISVSTASTMKKQLNQGVFVPNRTEKKEAEQQEKRAGLEHLIADYLSQLFVTLKAQAVETAKPAYIERQNAESLAILHGVMSDKAIRILEAAAAAQKIETPQ